ncbi:MAG: hypothetical protein GPJ54_17105 [Candidatus Heimdallarchaeota archaeon]|nr:hypothetical protein [Candidatus Heimdallarchaeota archaeon]
MSNNAKLYYADLEVLMDTGYYSRIIDEISKVVAPSSYQQIYKAKALRLMGRNNEALELLNNIDISVNLIISIKCQREKGHILLEMGYFETSQKMMNECFEILSMIMSDDPEIQNIKADILHTSGNLLSFKGDFQNALNFWEESFDIKKSLEKIIDQAILKNNIAIYYSIIEEYDRALDSFYEALTLIKPFEISTIITGILLNMGEAYFNSTNLEKALDFTHRSLDLTLDNSMDYIKSNCLLSLIKYYLIAGDKDNVDRYNEELLDLVFTNQSTFIQLMEKYAQALVLKSSPNKNDQQHAKSLFQQFLKPSVLDYQLFGNIVLNLGDLLVQEVYENGDPKVLEELLGIIEDLYEDAQEKQLFHYVIDSLILKSKILLIHQEYRKSDILMDQAAIIAEENNFQGLLNKVKTEQSEMQVKVKECFEAGKTDYTLRERIDLCGLRSYIDNQLTRRNSK